MEQARSRQSANRDHSTVTFALQTTLAILAMGQVISFTYDLSILQRGLNKNFAGHYMKPKRMHMVHNMVVNYGLYNKMDIVVSSNKYVLDKQYVSNL